MVKRGDYVIVDIETTGLSRHFHKITEIAAVKVRGDNVIDTFSTLVNPKCHIPSFITRLTGIDNEMVKDAPSIRKVLPDFLDFLGDSVFVAHNATFDYNFLDHNCRIHLKKTLKNPKLCTRKLANRLHHYLPSKKLSSLCKYFDVVNEAAHRAMGDAAATTTIFNYFLINLEERGINTTEDILKFQDSRIKR